MLKQFNSNTRKIGKIVSKINTNNLTNTDLTGSLLNIDIPDTTKYQSKVRSIQRNSSIVNNKTKIKDFHEEILQFGARYVSKKIDLFDNIDFGHLVILNATLDYGTDGAWADNFEVLVFGLHIPGDYHVEQDGDNVRIILHDDYIDFDSVTVDDIYVIGKFK